MVPLDGKVGYEEALRSSKFHASCVGFASMSRGFDLRVRPTDYDALSSTVRPEDAARFSGDFREIAGLPLSMSAESAVAFVARWAVTPVASLRRRFACAWVVRAADTPTGSILQHDFGVAGISKAKRRGRGHRRRVVMTKV